MIKFLFLNPLGVNVVALRHGKEVRKRHNGGEVKERSDKDHNGAFSCGAFFWQDSVQLFHTDLDLG
jgi:hypothetical protein